MSEFRSKLSGKGMLFWKLLEFRSELPEKGALFWKLSEFRSKLPGIRLLFWKLKGLVSESFTGGWKDISKLLSIFTAAFASSCNCLRLVRNRFEPGMHFCT